MGDQARAAAAADDAEGDARRYHGESQGLERQRVGVVDVVSRIRAGLGFVRSHANLVQNIRCCNPHLVDMVPPA